MFRRPKWMSPTSGTCLYRFIIFAMWHLKNAAFNFSIFESTEEIFSSMETTLSCKSFNWILFEMHIDTKKDDKTTIVMTMMTLCCLILRLSITAFNLTGKADMLRRGGVSIYHLSNEYLQLKLHKRWKLQVVSHHKIITILVFSYGHDMWGQISAYK